MKVSTTATKLATNINREMAIRNWSNPQLSMASGVSRTTLSVLRNCKHEASTKIIERLAEAFGKEPWEMLR